MLLEKLRLLECSLHSDSRHDREWLELILHPDFQEITQSGLMVNRIETITSLLSERVISPIYSSDFRIIEIGGCSAILIYRTSNIDGSHQVLRSSHWVLSVANDWTLLFHQGTPAK